MERSPVVGEDSGGTCFVYGFGERSMDLCSGLCGLERPSRDGDDANLTGHVSWSWFCWLFWLWQLQGSIKACFRNLRTLCVIATLRCLFFLVRHVSPFFRDPHLLSNAATSCFNTGSEGWGSWQRRPAQTCFSICHIRLITVACDRPRTDAIDPDVSTAEVQWDRHAGQGRMDGTSNHQRRSFASRSFLVRRL